MTRALERFSSWCVCNDSVTSFTLILNNQILLLMIDYTIIIITDYIQHIYGVLYHMTCDTRREVFS